MILKSLPTCPVPVKGGLLHMHRNSLLLVGASIEGPGFRKSQEELPAPLLKYRIDNQTFETLLDTASLDQNNHRKLQHPVCLQRASSSVEGDRLFIVGGFFNYHDSPKLNLSVYEVDLSDLASFRQLTQLQVPLLSPHTACDSTTLYIAGGLEVSDDLQSNRKSKQHLKVDFADATIKNLPSLKGGLATTNVGGVVAEGFVVYVSHPYVYFYEIKTRKLYTRTVCRAPSFRGQLTSYQHHESMTSMDLSSDSDIPSDDEYRRLKANRRTVVYEEEVKVKVTKPKAEQVAQDRVVVDLKGKQVKGMRTTVAYAEKAEMRVDGNLNFGEDESPRKQASGKVR
jgi:hypothetical protein